MVFMYKSSVVHPYINFTYDKSLYEMDNNELCQVIAYVEHCSFMPTIQVDNGNLNYKTFSWKKFCLILVSLLFSLIHINYQIALERLLKISVRFLDCKFYALFNIFFYDLQISFYHLVTSNFFIFLCKVANIVSSLPINQFG